MDATLFEAIVDRIESTASGDRRPEVHLYSWGEPFLHPRLPDCVRYVRGRGLRCGLSTNLNVCAAGLGEVVDAAPDRVRISVSGYYQHAYGRTHRGGDVVVVKRHMVQLRSELDRRQVPIPVQVLYHVYRHNADDNLAMMLALCSELGFKLDVVWACMMPVERCLRIVEGDASAHDRQMVEMLAVPPTEATARLRRSRACRMQSSELAINVDGSVQLCCASYGADGRISPAFLAEDVSELQRRRVGNGLCERCIAAGLNVYLGYMGSPEVDELGNSRLDPSHRFTVHQYGEPALRPVHRAGSVG